MKGRSAVLVTKAVQSYRLDPELAVRGPGRYSELRKQRI